MELGGGAALLTSSGASHSRSRRRIRWSGTDCVSKIPASSSRRVSWSFSKAWATIGGLRQAAAVELRVLMQLHAAVHQLPLKPDRPSQALLRNLNHRIAANAVNLAILTVAWGPSVLHDSRQLHPRRNDFVLRQGGELVQFVDRSMAVVVQYLRTQTQPWTARPTHAAVTALTASILLAPEPAGLLADRDNASLAATLDFWRREASQHPYDSRRIEYALELLEKVKR
jgi:hypothetical protein